jgi:hypothetical protein
MKKFVSLLVSLVMLFVATASFAEDATTNDASFWDNYSDYFNYTDEEYPDYSTATIMDDPEYFMYYEDDVDQVDVKLTEDAIPNISYLVANDWHGYEATVTPVFGETTLPCNIDDILTYFEVRDQIFNFAPERTEKYSWVPLFRIAYRCGSFLLSNDCSDVIDALNTNRYVLRIKDGIVALLDTFIYVESYGSFMDFILQKLGSPKCILVKENQMQETGYGYANYNLCYQYGDMWFLIEVAEDYSDGIAVQWLDEIGFTYMNPADFMEWLDYDQIIY